MCLNIMIWHLVPPFYKGTTRSRRGFHDAPHHSLLLGSQVLQSMLKVLSSMLFSAVILSSPLHILLEQCKRDTRDCSWLSEITYFRSHTSVTIGSLSFVISCLTDSRRRTWDDEVLSIDVDGKLSWGNADGPWEQLPGRGGGGDGGGARLVGAELGAGDKDGGGGGRAVSLHVAAVASWGWDVFLLLACSAHLCFIFFCCFDFQHAWYVMWTSKSRWECRHICVPSQWEWKNKDTPFKTWEALALWDEWVTTWVTLSGDGWQDCQTHLSITHLSSSAPAHAVDL